MVDLLFCEFLKLKRSNMFFISLLGGLVAPAMVFVGLLKVRLTQPNQVITYYDMFDQTNQYSLILFGIMVYGVIAAYLFCREYTENTLKSVLTIPVSKLKFLTSKYFMFLIWILILTLEAWVGTLFFSIVGQATEFHFAILVKAFQSYLLGGLLLYLSMSPFVLLTLWMKNIVPSVIATATVTLGGILLTKEDLAVLYPWASPYLLASGEIEKYGYSKELALAILIVVFLFGVISSFCYFKGQDVN